MSREAGTMTTAQKIAEILIEDGWVDFGGGSARGQVSKIFQDLLDPVAEFVETEIVTSEADEHPADGSYDA